jgi:hypothetical protein
LLPFNFAVGVGGGCDVIIKTLQLAVDKYIVEQEKNNDLPTRSLVSLDIKNMFNAVSRECLRELISQHFPTLEAFADVIYEEPGETYVRVNGKSLESQKVLPKAALFLQFLLHWYSMTFSPRSNLSLTHEQNSGASTGNPVMMV